MKIESSKTESPAPESKQGAIVARSKTKNSLLETVYLKTDELIPYARNARTHSPEQVAQIAASIREFGWMHPITIDEEKTILAGHGRLLAAQKLGLERVPVVIKYGLSEAQKRAAILTDNKVAENAGWDESLLKVEIADLKGLDFDLGITGFSAEEIDDLLKLDDAAPEAADDAAPEAADDAAPVSKPGDVWICGNHRVMCGDCRSADDMAKLIVTGSESVALYLTDPPYNVAIEGRTPEKMKIQNDAFKSDAEFVEFLTDCYSMVDGYLKKGAVFYIWFAMMKAPEFFQACKNINWKVYQNLVWVKNNFSQSFNDYKYKHEPCLYGYKEGAKHNWYGDKSQTTVLVFDIVPHNKLHPTMKPVDLFKYQICNSTKEKDLILDTFGGSGTTLIAAQDLNRIAYLMEIEPKFVDRTVKRWEEATGKEAFLENTGERFDDLFTKANPISETEEANGA